MEVEKNDFYSYKKQHIGMNIWKHVFIYFFENGKHVFIIQYRRVQMTKFKQQKQSVII